MKVKGHLLPPLCEFLRLTQVIRLVWQAVYMLSCLANFRPSVFSSSNYPPSLPPSMSPSIQHKHSECGTGKFYSTGDLELRCKKSSQTGVSFMSPVSFRNREKPQCAWETGRSVNRCHLRSRSHSQSKEAKIPRGEMEFGKGLEK